MGGLRPELLGSGLDWEESIFIPKPEFNTAPSATQTKDLGGLYPCLKGRFLE